MTPSIELGRRGRGLRRLLAVGVCIVCTQVFAEKDDVVFEWLDAREGAFALRGTIAVGAQPEAIWGVLTDYGRFPEIYPDVARVHVKDSNPRGATVVIHVKNFWTEYSYETRRDYVEPGSRISWRQIKGPYRDLSGEWTIRAGPESGRHRIICTTIVELESPVEAFVARQLAEGRMRKTLLRMRERLESAGR